jgi:hypothetical protein
MDTPWAASLQDSAQSSKPQVVAASRLIPSKIPARLGPALSLLLEAHDYAQDLGQSIWDFAVELSSLRQLSLTRSDFRWLVGKGLVEHAREITLAGEEGRTFRRSPSLLFGRRICFVLTESGMSCA